MNDELVFLESASGMLEAEILRSLLESRSVQVWLFHESAGTVFGLGVGPLAKVDIYVHRNDEEKATEILNEYHSGELIEDD
jgi:hypothetical protein